MQLPLNKKTLTDTRDILNEEKQCYEISTNLAAETLLIRNSPKFLIKKIYLLCSKRQKYNQIIKDECLNASKKKSTATDGLTAETEDVVVDSLNYV